MICPYCGCFFCVDDLNDTLPGTDAAQRFCRKECGRKAGKVSARRRQKRRQWSSASCAQKIRYMDEGEAFAALQQMRRKTGYFPHSSDPGIYECLICDGWHVTSHQYSKP